MTDKPATYTRTGLYRPDYPPGVTTRNEHGDRVVLTRPLVATGQGEYRREIRPADIEPLPARHVVGWLMLLAFLGGIAVGMFLS